MKSLERITTAVKLQKPDRFPVIAQIFGHAATLAGVSLADYIRDGELLARCQLKALKQYEYDAVFAAMDLNVETEAVGSVLTYRDNQYPFVKSYVAGATHIDHLLVPDPHQAGRMPELLKAAGIMRRELGDDVLLTSTMPIRFSHRPALLATLCPFLLWKQPLKRLLLKHPGCWIFSPVVAALSSHPVVRSPRKRSLKI